MPCYSAPHSYCNHDKNECLEIKADEYIKSVIDKLTDMLCRVLKANFSSDFPVWVDTDIKEWWEKHKEWDKQRKL